MKLDPKNLIKYTQLTRDLNERFINIHPIQRGGLLTAEAFKALIAYGDGYSICDNCLKGRIDLIENPPVIDFLKDLATFFTIAHVIPTAAARDSKRIVMKALKMRYPERKTVLIDSLAHYTTYLAIEANELEVKEVPNSGRPTFALHPDDYRRMVDRIIEETGTPPLLVVLTHVDYKYGNYNDPRPVGEMCKEYGVPFLLNAAYSGGILPIDCEGDCVDFLVCSGHKSMAASGPIGLLGFSDDFYENIMETSKIKGDFTSKSFPNKICSLLGCPPVYGAPLVTLMASFPAIVKRTQIENVEEESRKANYIIDKIKHIRGIEVMGNLPKVHPLTNVMTECFDEVAKTHPRKGFFLRDDFKEKGIIGFAPGITKEIKFNTYGLTWKQIEHFISSFLEIVKKYNIF